MLPHSALGRLIPPRGSVLIQRDERPPTVRGVWIPDRTRQAARAALATVVRVSPEIHELTAGDRVVLAAVVGAKQIRLGERDEIVLEVCKPSQILAKVLDEVAVENHGLHPFAGFSRAALAGAPEAFDDGDPLAC